MLVLRTLLFKSVLIKILSYTYYIKKCNAIFVIFKDDIFQMSNKKINFFNVFVFNKAVIFLNKKLIDHLSHRISSINHYFIINITHFQLIGG